MNDKPYPRKAQQTKGPEVLLTEAPPTNRDAERMILGCIILTPPLIEDVKNYPLRPDDFFTWAHQTIYRRMLEIHSEKRIVDPLYLKEVLRQHGELQQVGGDAYLAGLYDGVPRFSQVDNYCKLVADAATARGLLTRCHEVIARVNSGEETVAETLQYAQQSLGQVEVKSNPANWLHLSEIGDAYVRRIEAHQASGKVFTGLATGYHKLDLALGGLQRGDLIVVAARPSMGKSALVSGISEGAALSQANENPLIAEFSLEMSKEQWIERVIAGRSKVNSHKLRSGRLDSDEWRQVTKAIEGLSATRIFIDDTPGISPLGIRAKLRQLKRAHGSVDLVVVDYFQAMSTGVNMRGATRDEQLGFISGELKSIAKEFEIPLVLCCALGRSVEQTKDHRPRPEHMRECGKLEYDCDVFLGLYRDKVYHPGTDRQNVAEVIIGKQRMGPLGTIELVFLEGLTRFENMKHV